MVGTCSIDSHGAEELMSTQIEAATLQEWLEAHEPVTVVDIRTDDDYAQWAIPGSIHVNAYEALRNGRPGALADLTLPPDRPARSRERAGDIGIHQESRAPAPTLRAVPTQR